MTTKPTTLSEFVFEDDDTEQLLQNVVSHDKLLPADKVGILLYGSIGTGKTTLACALPNMIERARSGKANATTDHEFVTCLSAEANDTVKRINTISRLMPCNSSNLRFFVLDEFDVLTDRAQANFKALMTASTRCVFLLTTNHLSKVDPAIRDRCWCISMNAAETERWLPAARRIARELGLGNISDQKLRAIIDACDRKSARNIISSLEYAAIIKNGKAA